MNEVQTQIAELQAKGWTLAAISDEIGVTVNTVEKWKAGDTKPASYRATLAMMTELARRKRVPKMRRYNHRNTSPASHS